MPRCGKGGGDWPGSIAELLHCRDGHLRGTGLLAAWPA
jgi:hypothetical protein